MSAVQTFPEQDIWLQHRVSYGETDTMGLVYYGEYMHYFERVRSHFIREHGMSYAEVEARKLFLPVREASARYRSPARFDDLLWIRTGIDEWRRASIRFIYEIRDEHRERILATGHTLHACVGPDGKPIAVPDWLKELFTTGR